MPAGMLVTPEGCFHFGIDHFMRFETVCLSDRQFRFDVHALHTAV
jgi:hypothetical protein